MPTIGVFVGHTAIDIQTDKVNSGVVVAAHLGHRRCNLVVIDGRIGLNEYRFGVFARTYAVGNKGAEVERVFGRNHGGRAKIAFHKRPAVEVAYVAVHLPLYLIATIAVYIAREVEFEFVVGAEVAGRFGRGHTANGGQIDLDKLFAGYHLVGGLIGEVDAIARGFGGTYPNADARRVADNGVGIALHYHPLKGVVAAATAGNTFQLGAVFQANGRFFRHLGTLHVEGVARRDEQNLVGARTAVGVGGREGELGGSKDGTGDNRVGDVNQGEGIRRTNPPLGQPFHDVGTYRFFHKVAAQNLNAAATGQTGVFGAGIYHRNGQTNNGHGLGKGVARHNAVFARSNLCINLVVAGVGQEVEVEGGTVVARIGRAVNIPAIGGTGAGVFAFEVQGKVFLAAERVNSVGLVAGYFFGVIAVKYAGTDAGGGGSLTAVFVGYRNAIGVGIDVIGLDGLGGFARAPQVGQLFAGYARGENHRAHTGALVSGQRGGGQHPYLNLNAVVGKRLASTLQVGIEYVVARAESRRGVGRVVRGAVGGHKVAVIPAIYPITARRRAAPNGLHIGEGARGTGDTQVEFAAVVAVGRVGDVKVGTQIQVGRVERNHVRNGVEAPVGDEHAVARAVEAAVFYRYFQYGGIYTAVSVVLGQVAPRVGKFVVDLPTIGGNGRIGHRRYKAYRGGIGRAGRTVGGLNVEHRLLLNSDERVVARVAGVNVGYRNGIGGGLGRTGQSRVALGVGQERFCRGPFVGRSGGRRRTQHHRVADANPPIYHIGVHLYFRQRPNGHDNALGGHYPIYHTLVVRGDFAIYAVFVVERSSGPRVGRGTKSGRAVDIPLIRVLTLVGVGRIDFGGKGYRVAGAGLFNVGAYRAGVFVVVSYQEAYIGRHIGNAVVYGEAIGQRAGQRGRGGVNLGVLVGGFKDLACARAYFGPLVGVFATATTGEAFELGRVADTDVAIAVGCARRYVGQRLQRTAFENEGGLGHVATTVLVGGRESKDGGLRQARGLDVVARKAVDRIAGVVVGRADVGGHLIGRRGRPAIGVGRFAVDDRGSHHRVLVVNHHTHGVFGRVHGGNHRRVVTVNGKGHGVFAQPYATFARFYNAGNLVVVVKVASAQSARFFGLQHTVDIPTEARGGAGVVNIGTQEVVGAGTGRVARTAGNGVDNRIDTFNDVETRRARHYRRIARHTKYLALVAVAVHI